jgi:hypothetical protein
MMRIPRPLAATLFVSLAVAAAAAAARRRRPGQALSERGERGPQPAAKLGAEKPAVAPALCDRGEHGPRPAEETAAARPKAHSGSQAAEPNAPRRPPRPRRRQRNHAPAVRSRRSRFILAVIGATAAASVAYASSSWVVGLAGGSSGEAQSASVSNLTISAVASPAATNLLYPGGNGDVVLSISNPNPFPVTITAVQLPTNLTYATGYTTSALSVTQTGCLAATPSDVIWNYSTGSSGSSHTLTTPLTVAASAQSNNPLAVTMTNDASMTAAAPAACENTYFSMPALTGVTATGGSATATTSPATDSWTS